MTTPFPFQEEAVEKIQEFGGRCLLSLEMGLGKTFVSLLWIQRYLPEGNVVVVCPASVKYSWRQEARQHVRMLANVLISTNPHRSDPPPKVRLHIINYDILGPWMDYLTMLNPQLVIIDEGQYCKSQKALRTKFIRSLCHGVPHVLALSGTPLTNRPAELWPILNIVRPDLYPRFWNYAFDFCAPKRNHWGWDFSGACRLDVLHSTLTKNLMIRQRKEEVMSQLPKKSRYLVPIPIDRPSEYRKAEREFLQWLAGIDLVKAERAARAERLARMGYLKRLAGTLKLSSVISWIEDFLEDSDEKLTVFGIHQAVLKPLETHFRKQCVLIDGSIPAEQRKRKIDQFTLDRKTRLFLGQMQATGVGCDGLQKACSTMAVVELPWVPGELSQAIARLDRIGQTKPISIYFLLAEGTVERHLCDVLDKKQKILGATLDGDENNEEFDLLGQLEELLLENTKEKKVKR